MSVNFKMLTRSSYNYVHDAQTPIYECLDKKERGYAYMTVNLTECLVVLIPLRSRLGKSRKNTALLYPVCGLKHKDKYCGLDFTKMLLKTSNISLENYNVQLDVAQEYFFYDQNESVIREKATEYIKKYIKLCKKIEISNGLPDDDPNKEKTQEEINTEILVFRYSTLRSYHNELNIQIPSEMVEKFFK